METGTGLALWRELTSRLNGAEARPLGRASASPGPATIAAIEGSRFGKAQIVTARLGQG